MGSQEGEQKRRSLELLQSKTTSCFGRPSPPHGEAKAPQVVPPSGSSSPSVSSAASLVAISSPSPPPSPVASAPAAISSAAISPAASLSAVSRSAPVLDPRSTIDPRSTADLASSGHVDVQLAATSVPASAPSVPPTITVIPSNPSKVSAKAAPVMVAAANPVIVAPIAPPPVDSWVDIFKGTTSKRLEKKGSAFTLPSGEACVAIPNSLIEKHQKSWDSFILGQFYSDPPAQGTVHTIVNGIWSKQFRDVSVSKMEGNAFLFRIPNVQTRTRVLNQRLWQIDGQTMFVAKWEPGLRPVKPELTSAPIWLELRNVPFQCFNDDGLEHIASLVGEPKFLHPATASKTNLEVAKVFTIIDPRKPLPEAVNVQFQSGEIRRVEVSSPWMPPICAHCKEVGHSLRRCKAAPITCKACNSTQHSADACPRAKSQAEKKTPRRRRSKTPKPMLKEGDWAAVGLGKRTLQDKPVPLINPDAATSSRGKRVTDAPKQKGSVPKPIGRESKQKKQVARTKDVAPISEEDDDSSDVPSSPYDSDTDLEDEEQFTEVLSQRQQRSARGKETHVKQPKQQKFINKLLPGWSFDNNYDFSELGKIWILWHPSVKLLVLSKSLQMISCEVQVPDYPETFVVSFVYASNDETVMQTLWDELVALSSDSRVVGKAWAVMGDFNQTLHPSDHSATISQNVDRATRVFRETLLDASLVDLNFRGSTFTWWNKRANSPIAKKIDRVLVNDMWADIFPSALGFFGKPHFSDHAWCGILFDSAAPKTKKPFRFYNFLLKNPDFVPLIGFSWLSLNVTGSAMFRVSCKLKALKHVIREFSRYNYSDLEKRTQESLDCLLEAQGRVLENPTIHNAEREIEWQRKWQTLSLAEESFFLQRSRVTWLGEGDRNTAYFHKMASSRQAVNHIHYLFDVNGSRLDSLSAIQNHCVDYFENLLGGIQGPTMFAQEDISALLSASSQAPIQHGLDSPFTAEEIKAAFFSLPKNKASGPDGYSAEFFCSCWSFVGVEITAAVAEFFSSGQLLKPISCLNTVYKVISSLLAGRLKAVLPSIIGSSQSAFMPASFSIVVNGQSGGYFRSTQGLRQGDPMSPYLFVLAMEVFSGLLQSRYSSGYISYHPRTSELEISHLIFADDVMIFFDGGGSSLQGIYETLDDFAGWSGLHMNRDKTQLFYAGLSQTESNALASYGFTVGSLPIRYLGLPLMSRKLKVSEYEPLIGKITARFNAWAVKSLSFAGRAQLIGSVISGTVNFWISTFVLPKGCIRRIESLCSRFLWSGGTEKRGLVKVAWAHVCLPKKEGGLGLRRFADWNRTMCLRLVWLLFSNSGSLWVAWHKHHNISTSTNFWNQVESTGDSWSWKSILRLREPASVFIKCSLGNGRRASFWFDSWTPLGPLYNCFGSSGPSSLRVPLNATVSDVCNHQGWIIANPRSDQGVSLQIHLSTIALPSDDSGPDEFDWVVENKICKGFSSAKTWAVTRPRAAIVDWWDSVWFKDHIPKHAFNMWIATLDRLPTKTRLSSWGLQIQDTCGLCSLSPESRDHLFLSCDFALYLWNAVSLKLNMQGIHFTLWAELLSWLKSGNRRSPPTLRKLIAQFGSSGPSSLRVPLNATVSDVCNHQAGLLQTRDLTRGCLCKFTYPPLPYLG
ncbi:Reverse transcriptase zinc-binding domain [Arabidopsis thaliana x Arabidopsis arenosa]|uniref:Reverse transcriptase zinc-binding domain n=1 Tax=Arabidopsis thaliana x Arabidopsis arenosa TaxID=1240361 RepID=A0A8T1XBZ9_9BRAS|nr:Reverse transcriptase zinc-binding domain [Arabidopsis thaliana x Arabidopsis arenosa]